jgi:hypothetical protein
VHQETVGEGAPLIALKKVGCGAVALFRDSSSSSSSFSKRSVHSGFGEHEDEDRYTEDEEDLSPYL